MNIKKKDSDKPDVRGTGAVGVAGPEVIDP